MDSILVLASVIIFSIVIRKIIGYPVFRPKNVKCIYQRTWLTGYPAFSQGFILVGQNCMWVNVTNETVSIHSHFPFSVFLFPELLGIGWKFDKSKVIRYRKTTFGVRVRYQGLICEREFVLHVGDKDKFIAAINAIQVTQKDK